MGDIVAAVLWMAVGPGTGEGSPGLRADRVAWHGRLDGVERPFDPRSMELSPDGSGFAYYQGRPWPRVLYEQVAPVPSEPRALGKAAPFGRRPPRFDPSGAHVYFTVRAGDPRLAPEKGSAVATHAARVEVATGKLERLHPAGEASGSFAVLLDVHPTTGAVLIGTGSGMLQVAEDTMLEVAEMPAAGGPPAQVGLRVALDAEARYAAGAQAIVYSSRGVYYRFDRARGVHERLERRWTARAGDLELGSYIVPHLGSFGWDGFVTYPSLSFSPEVLAMSGAPPLPVSVRERRALLAGGPRDRAIVIVADCEAATATAEPWMPASPLRALLRGAPAAAPRLTDLARGLAASREPAPLPPAVRAKLLATGFGPSAGVKLQVEVLEAACGWIRIDRRPDGAPADERGTEVLAFDGSECWVKTPEGSYAEIEPEALCREANGCSVYRLLLDPPGLLDPYVRFEARSGDRIAFSYPDGYRGEVLTSLKEGRLLPAAVETPLVYETELARSQGDAGRAVKRVSFEEWREWRGRWIPWRVRLEDGIDPRQLDLLELEALSEAPARAFHAPGHGQ